ncbi:MAG: hypothetical protein JWR19_4172 [Pedosphaera sp.]|nr:hypothetical protein [Pedosphaera sp.]
MLAADRRQQRESQMRFRELERRAKEQSKLSAIEQAGLEVESFENQIDVLLSVHKTQGETWDWAVLASSLPPPFPQKNSYHELRAKQRVLVLHPQKREGSLTLIENARLQDEQAFQAAVKSHAEAKAEWDKLKKLACRILAGEHKAYIEALVELSPLAEISDLGSQIHFTVESSNLLKCALKVNGSQAIPSEVKTLTSSGKVSVKAMPKVRFHEIYQDYVCGCMLRVAREVFAMLPIDTLLITATADMSDPRTSQKLEQPVLSAIMPRAIVTSLDFHNLDSSDAMESFFHRGNFKASRKTGAFQAITPITPADINQNALENMGFADLLASIQRMRGELKSKITEFNPVPKTTASQTVINSTL